MTQFRELAERYQLEKILKSTRSGSVLRAADTQSGRTVAVKLINVGGTQGLEAGGPAFERLAAALAALRHPGLPAVLDFGFTTEGQAFLALELLEGQTLDAVAGAPPARVLTLLGQALNGLEVLASKGLVHHNVSPDNLFATATPAGEQVKLLGLGSAIFRPRGPGGDGAENARFRAPELAAAGPADWRADIYSLALTACHVLGATVGFGDAPVVQMPLALSFELDNDEALRQALERALRQNPAERPSHREMREAFRLALGGAAAQPQPMVPATPPVQIQTPPAPGPRLVPPPAPAAAPPPVQPVQPMQPVSSFSSPLPDPVVTPMPRPAPAAAPVAPPLRAVPPLTPAPAPQPPAPQPVAAAPVPAPAPAPEPAGDGELLSAVDDEVLNALLSVPPPPPRSAGAAGPTGRSGGAGKAVPFRQKKQEAPPAEGDAAAQPAPAKGSRQLVPVLVGVGAALLVIGALAAYWMFGGQPEEMTEDPAPAAVVPARPPQRPAAERLQEALLHLAQEEDNQARLVLQSLTFEDQGLLKADGCRLLSVIEETLALSTLERLPQHLAEGLRNGDLGTLQGAVSAATEQGVVAGLPPQVRADFDRARSLVEQYGQAQAAAAAERHAEVLERFAALEQLLPDLADPGDLRNKAAAAIEAEAAKLVEEGKYDQGLARLDPIVRFWPDRAGLKPLVTSYTKFKQDQAEQEALLARLPSVERRRKPHEGLEEIKGIEPTPNLAPKFAEIRRRLEDQLARIDQAPPKVDLRPGFVLTYFRGTPIELSFRVTDDYQVDKVKFLARPEGGKMRELPLEASRNGTYTVEIPSSFHQNGTVEFYVTATDLSGHEGSFGTASQPQQVTRR